jgi:hypothetical protein
LEALTLKAFRNFLDGAWIRGSKGSDRELQMLTLDAHIEAFNVFCS